MSSVFAAKLSISIRMTLFRFIPIPESSLPLQDANPISDILQELKSLLIRIGRIWTWWIPEGWIFPHYELKNYVERFSGRMDELLNQKEALEELQESYVKQTVEIGHFVGLNLDLKKLAECKYIKFRFGRIPKECYEKLSKYEDNPYVLFFQCTSDAPTIGAFISLLWNTFSRWTPFSPAFISTSEG